MPLLWASASVAFVLSLAGKLLSDAFLTRPVPLFGELVGLVPSLNPGVAFGMMLPFGLHNLLVPIALALMAYVAVRHSRTLLSRAGFGLIIGGALCNVLDRIGDGVVTDFFQVGTFPIFNVADSCITVGVVLLLVDMLLERRKHQASSSK